jgi:hypothetical protein
VGGLEGWGCRYDGGKGINITIDSFSSRITAATSFPVMRGRIANRGSREMEKKGKDEKDEKQEKEE